MGVENSSNSKLTIDYYSTESHSVEGLTDVFHIKGESVYLISTTHSNHAFTTLAKAIDESNSSFLVKFYGDLMQNQKVNFPTSCISLNQSKKSQLFWAFYNFTIEDWISAKQKYDQSSINQQIYPSEETAWSILQACTSAALTLINFNIFFQFQLANVQVAPFLQIKLYWARTQINNSHWSYYQAFLNSHPFQEAFYPPQLMQSIHKKKIIHKFDLQKASIFTLGMLMIFYLGNVHSYKQFYLLEEGILLEKEVSKMLEVIKKRYSSKLTEIITDMLLNQPAKRINFHNLRKKIKERGIQGTVNKVANDEIKVSVSTKRMQMKEKSQKSLLTTNLRY